MDVFQQHLFGRTGWGIEKAVSGQKFEKDTTCGTTNFSVSPKKEKGKFLNFP